MNVPDVVKTAMKHERRHRDRRSGQPVPPADAEEAVRRSGAAAPLSTPTAPSTMWKTPRGSLNQFGPLIPNQPSTLLTAPVALNRNSHSTVIATELVTDGK